MLRSLTRRIERIEVLVHQCHRVKNLALSVQVLKSIERSQITFDEWVFIARHGFCATLPRTRPPSTISSKQFVKRAPPAVASGLAVGRRLALVHRPDREEEPLGTRMLGATYGGSSRTVRRMRPRRKAVESEKRAWLRDELRKLWLHMGEERFDPKKELRRQTARSGRFVEAGVGGTRPPVAGPARGNPASQTGAPPRPPRRQTRTTVGAAGQGARGYWANPRPPTAAPTPWSSWAARRSRELWRPGRPRPR